MPFDEKVDSYRYYDKEFFDADYIFNFEALRDPDQYQKLIAADEQKTLTGAKGTYVMNDSFNLIICANYTTEKQMQDLINHGIPNI